MILVAAAVFAFANPPSSSPQGKPLSPDLQRDVELMQSTIAKGDANLKAWIVCMDREVGKWGLSTEGAEAVTDAALSTCDEYYHHEATLAIDLFIHDMPIAEANAEAHRIAADMRQHLRGLYIRNIISVREKLRRAPHSTAQ